MLSSSIATAQYKFESKELKKIYKKIEKAYDNYDYQTMLDLEKRALQLFEPSQDTLTALFYSFLAEAWNCYICLENEKRLNTFIKIGLADK